MVENDRGVWYGEVLVHRLGVWVGVAMFRPVKFPNGARRLDFFKGSSQSLSIFFGIEWIVQKSSSSNEEPSSPFNRTIK